MQDMTRIRRPVNITLDPEIIEALAAWIERQQFRLGRSGVIEVAIREFLERAHKRSEK